MTLRGRSVGPTKYEHSDSGLLIYKDLAVKNVCVALGALNS